MITLAAAAAPIVAGTHKVALESNSFFVIIEYFATFFCGMVGGMAAVRKGYDLFAILTASYMTGLGGGIIRDICLGALPPVGISDRGFVFVAIASGIAVAIFHPEVEKHEWMVTMFDALALGMFAVNGAGKALTLNMGGMTAVFLGMITAVGGGIIRAVLLNEIPMVIGDRHWYALPAAFGAVSTVIVWKCLKAGLISFQAEIILDCLIVLLIVTMRMVSIELDLRMPGAMRRTKAVSITGSIKKIMPKKRSRSALRRRQEMADTKPKRKGRKSL